MALMEMLRRYVYGEKPPERRSTSQTAASRLKVVLASDRTGIDEATMEQIRAEIRDVVAKYVVISEEGVNFDVMSDERVTLLTATFPLTATPRQKRPTQVLK